MSAFPSLPLPYLQRPILNRSLETCHNDSQNLVVLASCRLMVHHLQDLDTLPTNRWTLGTNDSRGRMALNFLYKCLTIFCHFHSDFNSISMCSWYQLQFDPLKSAIDPSLRRQFTHKNTLPRGDSIDIRSTNQLCRLIHMEMIRFVGILMIWTVWSLDLCHFCGYRYNIYLLNLYINCTYELYLSPYICSMNLVQWLSSLTGGLLCIDRSMQKRTASKTRSPSKRRKGQSQMFIR